MAEVITMTLDLENPNVENRLHCILYVFGYYYEYGPKGVTFVTDLKKANFAKKEWINGLTSKTFEEFVTWNKGWVPSAYEPGWNDCWHYAEATCKFLGVGFPIKISDRKTETNNNYSTQVLVKL